MKIYLYNYRFMSEFESWTDTLPRCTQSGIGVIPNARDTGGIPRQTHEFMHKCLNLSKNNIQFYGIFCAYNGDQRAAKYVSNRLAYEIFEESPITVEMAPEQIQIELKAKFSTVAMLYNQDVNELLVRRLLLKEQQTEESKEMVSKINAKLQAGTTALAAVIVADHIYIINCGNSRVLALLVDSGNSVDWQLNEEHDMDNQDEIERLKQTGVSVQKFESPTRAVGDCFRGLCYTDNEDYKGATGPPLISTPDVYVYPVDEFQCSHLLICSESVVKVIQEIGIEPTHVNQFLLSELVHEKEHSQTKSCVSLAQAVLDSLTRKHRESATEHEDMSLILASLSEIMSAAVQQSKVTMTTTDASNSLSMEDTIDSGDGTITTNDPRPYVDCDGFNEHPRAQELRIEIERLFVKISKKNIAKDSIEEEGPFSIDL
uniref:PPM-type phosphatase domain-containing protein n=1 Tax=Pristionchus pacificus TaxID=54126 RepID=A0A8R1YG24_PRIPA